ncbi:MAG TPA: hypothetical protein VFR92_10720 [Sphingomicrobium sp.]|jgi:hypothetical protein|nr:hypothetical protein [Sphingomicrobium sp.]
MQHRLNVAIGGSGMRNFSVDCAGQDGLEALALMEDALAVLDRSGFSLEAGAELDLAICRLRAALGPLAPVEREDVPAPALQAQPVRAVRPAS